jgi:hypothetical protein
LVVVLAGVAASGISPCVAETSPDLHGVRIPQFDPLAVGPPAYERAEEMELDDGALGGPLRR